MNSICDNCVHNCKEAKHPPKSIWCNAEYGRNVRQPRKGCINFQSAKVKKEKPQNNNHYYY